MPSLEKHTVGLREHLFKLWIVYLDEAGIRSRSQQDFRRKVKAQFFDPLGVLPCKCKKTADNSTGFQDDVHIDVKQTMLRILPVVRWWGRWQMKAQLVGH